VKNVQIGNLTSGFHGDTHANVAVPFGSFEDSIDYTGHAPAPTSFSFAVTDKGDNLTLSDLASNVYEPNIFDPSSKENIFLASNVFANHNAGNVGALAGTSPSTPPSPGVPEPATWAMMLLGIGAVGGTLRRCRQGVASPAKA
jgi:hypothetical protein